MSATNQETEWLHANDERKDVPLGIKLCCTLRGHTRRIGRIAWSTDGEILASPSEDDTIRLWDVSSGECLRVLRGHMGRVNSVAFDPTGKIIASGSHDGTIRLWDVTSGQVLKTLECHQDCILTVAFDPSGRLVASGSYDTTVKLWQVSDGRLFHAFESHQDPVLSVAFDRAGKQIVTGSEDHMVKLWGVENGRLLRTLGGRDGVNSVAFSPGGNLVAAGTDDRTVRLWEAESGRLVRTLEGHTESVSCIDFSSDGRFLASKSQDGSIRVWRVDSGDCLVAFPENASNIWSDSLAFHPHKPLLAATSYEYDARSGYRVCVIHIYELGVNLLLGQVSGPNAHYVNAKVVLVGDTGVGKSGLSLVLTRQVFAATESTAGRRIWTFDSKEVCSPNGVLQTRETLLWDLAGQPGYRVIHQLHLNEVAVALVIFDSRSETDPLAGVRHWERALRLAHQRQGDSGVPMKKFLVSARNDRGVVSVSKERLNLLKEEYGFDGYFETSAKEGWQIEELRSAIEKAIQWDVLPEVSSSQLFADIKAFLVNVKESGLLLASPEQLYGSFVEINRSTTKNSKDLRAQFETCIGRLEARDLLRRLTFGGYVLLQPELLDAYASAMVNIAREEPDGLGSLDEKLAISGRFFVPPEQKVTDPGQEQLLLYATVEELVRNDLALRENADDGRYLVFPSQFNRDYEDAPEPKGKAVAITFDGPVQSLYATLTVRLGHSGLFSTGRAEMWRNAAVFTAKAGGRCGLFVNEFSEGRGRLILFYDNHASQETRYHFEEYVLAHTIRRSLRDSVSLVRFFVCQQCGEPVPDAYVKTLRNKGRFEFNCPCGATVSLAEPKERIHFKSAVEVMDRSADRQRDFDTFVVSAKGETSTPDFTAWAGGDRLTLAIVFTDVVDSTKLGNEIGDSEMEAVRRAHFEQSRKLIEQHQGREIKTIGDSFMVAFKCVGRALDYARALQKHTGHVKVQIRAGIHIGPMSVDENDVFGGTVNYASRVVGAIEGAKILLSDRAKDDLSTLAAKEHLPLQWQRHDDVKMKGFNETVTLWSLKKT